MSKTLRFEFLQPIVLFLKILFYCNFNIKLEISYFLKSIYQCGTKSVAFVQKEISLRENRETFR